jgi:iron complex outermembrane receptor protein
MRGIFSSGRLWLLVGVAIVGGPAIAQEIQVPAADTPVSGEAPLDSIAVDPMPAANAPEAGMSRARDFAKIEEIVVTATKRDKALRDIPASINAISGEKLESEGHLNLIDYIQDTPGVTVTQSTPGLTRFSMRGVSTDTAPSSIIPSAVGFFVGDTAFTDPYVANVIPDLSAFDLSGVQVLKGPQGTLFGGAALSGAVRYELQDPVQGEWQLRGFSQVSRPQGGSYALTEGAAVNIPLLSDDELAVRLTYLHRKYPGLIDDTYSQRNDVDEGKGDQIRGILLWEPGNWKVKYTHLTQDFSAPDQITATQAVDDSRSNGLNVIPSPLTHKFGMDAVELGYSFDSMRLVSLSSRLYKHYDSEGDGTAALLGPPPQGYPPALTVVNSVNVDSRQFSQELRLQSTDSGPLDWLVGLYYYRYTIDFALGNQLSLLRDLNAADSALSTLLSQIGLDETLDRETQLLSATTHSNSTEKAAFFDLIWKPWEPLELEGGARFYQTAVDGNLLGYGILVRAINQGPNVDQSADIVEHGVNPRFTATWHLDDSKLVYAQASKGYRFGGIQIAPSTANNGIPPTFKSDSLWNYELGLRTSWLERRLTADITGFYIQYKNPILQQNAQSSQGGVPTGYLDNVASAVSKGLETSLQWYTPVEGLSLSLSAAFTSAYNTAQYTAANGELIEPGAQMPGVAPQQYNGSIQYLQPLGAYSLGLSTGYNYIGQGYSNLQHDVEINGYGSWKAGVVLSRDVGRLRPKLAFNVDNLLNTVAATGGTINTPTIPGPFTTYFLNAPRTYLLRLSVDL